MMRFEIGQCTDGTGLVRRVWVFDVLIDSPPADWLEFYAEQERQSKRAEWRNNRHWSRLSPSDNTIKERPAIPNTIAAQAKGRAVAEFLKMLGVGV